MDLREAVEKSVRKGLAASGGTWFVDLGDDEGHEFKPQEDGKITLFIYDEHRDQDVVRNFEVIVREID